MTHINDISIDLQWEAGALEFYYCCMVETNGWYYIETLNLSLLLGNPDSLFWAWLVVTTKPSTHNLIKMPNYLCLASPTSLCYTAQRRLTSALI